MKKFGIFFTLTLCISMTSCLKTRAQLKENSPEETHSISAPAPRVVESSGGYAIDEVKAEITRMTGRIEDLEKGQTSGRIFKDEDIKKIETRLMEVEKTQIEVLERLKQIQSQPTHIDSKELLEKAKTLFDEEQYEESIQSLNQYFKNPSLKTAEEATFLRAEAYYKLKDYKKAIVEYSKFPEKYSGSSRMPRALYKIGVAFDQMGMKEDAQAFYQELTDKYPKSSEAKDVKRKSSQKQSPKSSGSKKKKKKKK